MHDEVAQKLKPIDFLQNVPQYDTSRLSAVLQAGGVVELPNFLTDVAREVLVAEAEKLLSSRGRTVDALIASTGNTPRKYTSVGRDAVFADSGRIADLYLNPGMTDFLARLAGAPVITCPYEPEQVVVNRMSAVGDTHGWHWDDYSYSLVLVLEAPGPGAGGQVEYVDGTSWNKEEAAARRTLSYEQVEGFVVARGGVGLRSSGPAGHASGGASDSGCRPTDHLLHLCQRR